MASSRSGTTMPERDLFPLRQALQQAALRWPEAPALTDGGQLLTYRVLADLVARRADGWRAAGLVAGDRIGIAASRSVETIVSIVAAVESGLAYVPLDLGYPTDRLQAMLDDAQVRAVVGEPEALATLQSRLDTLPSLASPRPVGEPPHAGEGDLVYVLFTSGSTGRPKGVAMGLAPLAHLTAWHVAHARLGQPARTLQFAPLSFDVHFQEIFSTLATGGTLVLPADADRRDPARLRALLARERVQRLYLPYVALQMLAQADAEAHRQPGAQSLTLQDVVSAGEQLQVTPDIRALFERLRGAALHNHYGPTETHVVTAFELQGDARSWPQIPPIGRALPHVRVWLRPVQADDEAESHTAPSELAQGELMLGGDTLADGYLGRPDLTAERFLEGLAGPDGVPSRWYATGDLVRQDGDGTLTYLGRADQQLKVDGFRIEPGDIELALMAHPGIQDAVVTAPADPDGSRVLTAHVVIRAGSAVADQTLTAWRAWLRDRLPEYMVPVRFAVLDKLPTTPSGKIDRRGLPLAAPTSRAPSTASDDAAGAPLIDRLRALWQELLGTDALPDDANVFDHGARSLLVMRFVSRAREQGISLNVADVYDRPTVAGLAALLDANANAGVPRRERRQTGATTGEGMAIVGMAARVGTAHDVDTFWQQLLDNVETLRRFRADEIDPAVPASLRDQPNFVAARGVLHQADCFDAGFFGLSAREATLTDPQQRLFLELCWSALEHAGIDPGKLGGDEGDRVGVYAGTANNAYLPAMRAEHPELIAQAGEFAAMLANEKDYVATRVAHRLNFNGPAVSIHTACSTSLVAVAQAWHALAQGQCDIALAGGATVIVPQLGGYLHVEGGMESADGRCRPFDAQASGTVFGSGGGVVVLKRLSQALADGDTVYGVIEGVGLNNDGGDKASFTAPSVSGQAQAIRMALEHARVSARQIGYVEAHGTGTALGDPIEVAALSRAWSQDTQDAGFCTLGSVKGHVGHLVAAAGVIGLIKATLSLHHGRIPGTLHFSQPNPQIDFAHSPFQVSAEALDWPRGDTPRRAAVSSFGVGGTNAHVIVAEAPAAALQPLPDAAGLQLLPISARHPEALLQRARDLADHLERHPELPLAAVSATLMRGRQAMPQRQCVVANHRDEAIAGLRAISQAQAAQRGGRVVFAFPGQGSQHPGMARELVEQLPAFQHAFDEVLSAAPAELAATLRRLLVDSAPTDEAAAAELAETRLAQPALFAVSHALGAWLDSLGLRPHAVIGHSIGEYAAACHAGVMSPQDAMRAVIERGEAMFDQPAGSMLAVRTGLAALQPLPAGIDVAAVNAPELTVLAGPHADIDALATSLEQRGVAVTRLKVSHAFHSASMEGALPRVQAALARASLSAPKLPVYSCVSGVPLSAERATDPAYWASQVRAPVAFSQAVQAEQALGDVTFIEVGPGQALTALIRQHRVQGQLPRVVPLLSSAQAALPPARHALQALGQLWCLGLSPAWPLPARTPRVALPTYPFRREVHWFKRRVATPAAPELHALPPTLSSHPPTTAMNRLPRIEQEIIRILADVAGLPPEATDREATFVDQGLDSLSLTQATLAFEQTFGIRLRFRRLLEDLDTLPKLAAFFDGELPSDRFAEAPPAMALPAAEVAPAQAASAALGAAQPAMAVAQLPQPMAPMVAMAPMAAATGVQALIQQQMLLMQQQLALLAGQSLPAAQAMQVAPVAPASALPTQIAATPVAAPAAAATPVSGAAPAADTQPAKNALVEKPFGASARIVLTAQNEYTPAQQKWIDDFIRDYNARTGSSKSFSQQHRKVMADPRVVTGFNPQWKDLVYPIVADRSEGARIWDIDGNEYIDLLSCFGANFLGYKREDVTQAMVEQLHKGIEVGPQHPLAADVARLMSEFTGMERVGFCNTGSEAVMGAMRIARTVTGRKKIAIFNNSYHGIFDEVIVRGTKQLRSLSAAPGILANAVENILVLDYDSPESLEVLRQCAHELAAIMIEPIQNKYPTLQPAAFVQQLREIATKGGAALIFDEVVTGFRVAPGGAQEFYGVRADIATYGKIIGGGLPFAAIAGNSRWLDALDGGHWQYGDDSFPEAGVTYFAGTFVRHPLALAAARATLLHIKAGGRALYQAINGRTQRMVDRINAAFAERGAPARAVHCASLWRLSWDDSARNVSLFYYLARFKGLHLYEQFGHFVTEAMTDADCGFMADTFIGVMDELMSLGFIDPRAGSPSADMTRSSAPPAALAPTSSPLTPGQTERWLAAIYDPAARVALNESFCVSLRGDVDRPALKLALQDVLQRHEAFKLRFDLDQPRQILEPNATVPVEEVDLRARPDSDQALDQHSWEASATVFDLDQAPLARASILSLADGRVVVHVVASHLVFDGWASSVFNAELAQAYHARRQGRTPPWGVAESALRFAETEHARFEREEGQASVRHWQQALQSLPPAVSLGDQTPTGPRTFAGDTVRARLDGAQLDRLREQARSHGATLFQWLLHAVAELIWRESGRRDVVVSIPFAAQSLQRHGPLLADGVLDLPVRIQTTDGEPLADRVRRIKSTLMDAMEFPLMTQGTAARALGLQAEGSKPALTSIYFNLNPKVDLSGWAPLDASMHEGRKRGLLSEVFFNFHEQADALTLDLHHSSEHLSRGRAQALVDCLMHILADGADALPAGLDPRVLTWNQTDRPLDAHARVEAWVSRQAMQTPTQLAVVSQDGSLTYQELEAQANQIARLLQARGAAPGQRVGISLPRGRHLLPAMLGVLKTGASYVPLDPGFPGERLKMMAEDAGLTLVVTHSTCAQACGLPHSAQLQLDREAALLEAAHATGLPVHTDTQAPAYVIYTSGSTGRPKGVAVPHRAVCNFLASMQRQPGLQASDHLLAVTTLSFDIAVLELLLPLVTGGTVVLATRDQAMDGEALIALASQHHVSVMQATPTTWHLLLDAGWQPPSGFKALVGGEPLPAALASALLARGVDVWNMYGPTETTVWSTLSHITDASGRIAIGHPIDNTQVWILDEALRPVPVGAEGEICIGGDGVALGYHGRPDLTAERFVALPWGPRPGRLVYRTGDLGRWREDGQIEHLGRMDFQVKIRGYRIELGEIEAQLEKLAGVSRAVVIACEVTPGDMALIGYVVPQAGAALDTGALRNSLRQTLPDYMLPRSVLVLPALPLLPNNKVDRKALPVPSSTAHPSQQSPRPETSEPARADAATAGTPLAQAIDTVAREMGQLLGRERLRDSDHFFEQGGHSLMAAKLSAALAKALGQRPGLRVIFDHPTPAGLASALLQLKAAQAGGGASAGPTDAILIRADQSSAPLSQMQERVWFLENLTPGTVVHSIPTGHRLLGPLNVDAFNQAWRLLIERQSVLRTVVERTPEGDVQRILPELPFSLIPFDDFSHLPEDERKPAMNEVIAELVETPYDLEKGPLFTARLFRLAPEEHGLLFQAHHLIWDAWSFDLLYVDLPELYAACLEGRPPRLPALTVSYGDFAAWHNEWMTGPELQRQLGYWREQLTPLPPALDLPLDHPRPAVMSGRGGSFQFNLAKDVTDALRAQARQRGRTLYITLLAAYALALHRVTKQNDFVIGTPVRGREQPALEHLMGFFVNMLPLRMQPGADMTLPAWLDAVHRKVVEAFSYPDVPFDHLVHVMQVPRDRSRPPIHQASFSYQDVRERTTRWGNVDHQRMPTPMLGAAQDLSLWCVETRNHIEFVFTFNADVLETETVAAFGKALERLLREIVTDPDRPLSGYDFTPGAEAPPPALDAPVAPSSTVAAGQAAEPTAAVPESVADIVADIWRGLLGLDRFGVDEDFFDRGGHSLLVMRAVTQIRKRTGRAVTVHTVFDNPTPRRLARALDGEERTHALNAQAAPAADPAAATANTVIPHREQAVTAPLSQMQQRIWYIENVTPHSVSHHIPSAHRLVGELNVQALDQAWQQLMRRQTALRTVVERTPTGDLQRVSNTLQVPLLPLDDLSHLPEDQREARLRQRMSEIAEQPLDLEQGPLFAIRLFKLADQDHVLFFLVHHLIWDGWSFQVFNDELSELYAAALTGRPARLPGLPVTYGDFAAWHNEWMSGDVLQAQTAFWLTQMTPPPPPLALPVDRARPPVMSGQGASCAFLLDPEATRRLRDAAQAQGRTLFTTLLGAFGLMLHKLTGQEDLVIGTPVRGRDHAELESLIGFFVNTLPLRLRPRGDLPVSDWFTQVQRQAIDALSHPDVPLDHLVRSLQLPRDASRAPLHQALFSYQDARERQPKWGNVLHKRFDVPMVGTTQDLALWCVETPEGIEFTVSYNADILDASSAQLLGDRLSSLLRRLPDLTGSPLSAIDILCDREREDLRRWNQTATEWPDAQNVVDLLRQQPHVGSAAIAISQAGERALSHAELWARASQIARHLRAHGVGRGALVGVCMPRCPDLLATVLGILQSGAAYVPLDPDYPAERLSHMAQDARLAWVISRSDTLHALDWPRDKALLTDLDEALLLQQPDTPLEPDPARDASLADAAYVIYTSGSTGLPKGVVVPHGSVLNFLRSMAREPGLQARQRLLAVTTLSFDISVLELLLPVLVGAEVVMCRGEDSRDPFLLKARVEEDIDVMQATPSTWHALVESGWQGAPGFVALVGGEPLPAALAGALLERCDAVWNMYGPTETTVWSTCWRVEHPERGVRIGQPIANTQVHVLTQRGQLCPIGTPGEICIGGDGVTSGYLHRPELTAERFVRDPFNNQPGARVYRTGDLGRWLADGTLEHLGRLDHQVKVRGHRIELGEIEAALLSQTAIGQAVVLAREDQPGDVRLVAYCVPRNGQDLGDGKAVTSGLASRLPDYMLPQHIVSLPALPRLPNGKVDRAALPRPNHAASRTAVARTNKRMPATPLEVTMAAVWQELIDTDDIGLDDNFFDLGGHSLLAMRAVTEIKRRTGLTLHVRRLIFETLGQLAASADKGLSPSAPPQPGAKLTHDGGSGSGQRADKPAEQQVGQQAKGGWLSRLLGR
jgi:amino acid adenylation domain-containing protein